MNKGCQGHREARDQRGRITARGNVLRPAVRINDPPKCTDDTDSGYFPVKLYWHTGAAELPAKYWGAVVHLNSAPDCGVPKTCPFVVDNPRDGALLFYDEALSTPTKHVLSRSAEAVAADSKTAKIEISTSAHVDFLLQGDGVGVNPVIGQRGEYTRSAIVSLYEGSRGLKVSTHPNGYGRDPKAKRLDTNRSCKACGACAMLTPFPSLSYVPHFRRARGTNQEDAFPATADVQFSGAPVAGVNSAHSLPLLNQGTRVDWDGWLFGFQYGAQIVPGGNTFADPGYVATWSSHWSNLVQGAGHASLFWRNTPVLYIKTKLSGATVATWEYRPSSGSERDPASSEWNASDFVLVESLSGWGSTTLDSISDA